jgi:hypothetical protein
MFGEPRLVPLGAARPPLAIGFMPMIEFSFALLRFGTNL